MRKTKLFLISLASVALFSACGVNVPEPPAIWQCQWNGSPRAFYCVNTKTKERMKLEASDPRMKAAQCLSANDYKRSEEYVKLLIELARERCR